MTFRGRQQAVAAIACALTLTAAQAALADPPPPAATATATATPAPAAPTTGSGAVVVVGTASGGTVPTDGTTVGAATGTVTTGSETTATATAATTDTASAADAGDTAAATATATDPQAQDVSGATAATASTGKASATSNARATVDQARLLVPGTASPIVTVRGGSSISRATRHGKTTRSRNVVCITGDADAAPRTACRRERGDPPAVSVADGRVTANSVTASSQAVARPGRAPRQGTGMSVRHLKVRHDGDVLFDVVSASTKSGSHPTCAGAPVRRGTLCATVEVHGPDGLRTTATLVIRRGADLMDPHSYHRNRALQRAFRALRPELDKVRAEGGPLPGLSIRLAVRRHGTSRTATGRRRAFIRITAIQLRFHRRLAGARAQSAILGLSDVWLATSKSVANVASKAVQVGKKVVKVGEKVTHVLVTVSRAQAPSAPPPLPIATLAVPAHGLHARHGVLRLEFTCPVSLQGRLVLTDAAGRRAAQPATLRCTPGTTARLRFKLSRRLRAQLAAGRAVTVRARLLLGLPASAAVSIPAPLVIRPAAEHPRHR